MASLKASLNSQIVRYRATTARAVFMALFIVTGTSCSSITDSRGSADHTRILVTGTSETPLTLVTSTVFGVQYTDEGIEQIILGEADTAQLSLPIDRRVEFQGSDRILVALSNPSTNSEAAINMRVLIDGNEVYRQTATLLDTSLRYIHFLF